MLLSRSVWAALGRASSWVELEWNKPANTKISPEKLIWRLGYGSGLDPFALLV